MTAPTLPVSSVVNVQVEMSPVAAALRNFGACLIVGSTDVIDVQERIRTYTDISSVAADFGTATPEYLAAQAFFAQSPKPTSVQVGRWASAPTSGLVRGRMLTVDEQKIVRFTGITDGAFDVTIDGAVVNLTKINLSAESNLNGVASKITAALESKGTCTFDGTRFVLASTSTGEASKVSGISSTALSQALGLDSSTTAVAGQKAETLADAFSVLLDFPTWYMAFVAAPHDAEAAVGAAGIVEAASPSRIVAFTSQDVNELDPSKDDTLGAQLKALGYNRSIVMYSSKTASAAASVLGRMSTVNFEGSNTCITLKFKQCPGVEAENLRSSQAAALKAHNVNVFAAYQNDTSILQEGVMSGGNFIDEMHGLDWLQNRVETDLWNLLYTSKKIGQDESGADNLVATVSKSIDQAVTNGLVAPGVWNGDEFGALKKGDTLSTGYYVYIQPLEEQAQSEREARKAPPIQIAVKLKGAIHFVDVTITVNR